MPCERDLTLEAESKELDVSDVSCLLFFLGGTRSVKIFAFLGCLLPLVVLATPIYGEMQPPDNIAAKEELPIEGVNIVRTEQGNTYFISKDGRYIFQGPLYDVWNGIEIDSVEKLERFSDRVDLDHLGVRKEKLFAFNLGSGDKEVHVFVDPRCHHCRKLVKDIRNSEGLLQSHVFRVVVSPISSEQSRNRARKLRQVAQENATRALDAFVANTDPDIELQDKNYPQLEYNILLAKALSIQSVPYLVSPDGRIRTGRPRDLAAFLHPGEDDQKE